MLYILIFFKKIWLSYLDRGSGKSEYTCRKAHNSIPNCAFLYYGTSNTVIVIFDENNK